MTTPAEFEALLSEPEGRRLEFKAARNRYDFDELVRYVVAIANEGGGTIVLGVSDSRPRRVLGTRAFPEPGRTEGGIFERLGRRVSVETLEYTGHRILLVHVPPRLPGEAWHERGTYWMRAGESLVPMPDDELRLIHAESAPDFSADPLDDLSLEELDPDAIQEFRRRWALREGNARIETWSAEELLQNAEMMVGGRLTRAALLLLGTEAAVRRRLPQAEIVFEYRSSEAAGPPQDRAEFQAGFLLTQDRLWEALSRRNDRQSYQDGLFRAEVPTFDEAVVREAVLNAFCHREYRLGGSLFVRQYPRRLEVISPGGFPPGVTRENILDQQNPRNRRLADALRRCGLVERAGQGVNLMFERSVRQSKPLPEYREAGPHAVHLVVHGNVTNPAFLGFIERVGEERLASFDTRDLLILHRLQANEPVPEELRARLPRLLEIGVVESVGRGRGARYLLSRRFYSAMGQRGVHTRRRGLGREEHKALILRHLREHGRQEGVALGELQEVLPSRSRHQLNQMLSELRDEGLVRLEGQRRWARWFPVPDAPDR